jgi:hypothetical protein
MATGLYNRNMATKGELTGRGSQSRCSNSSRRADTAERA